jgi:hypothetical protein
LEGGGGAGGDLLRLAPLSEGQEHVRHPEHAGRDRERPPARSTANAARSAAIQAASVSPSLAMIAAVA